MIWLEMFRGTTHGGGNWDFGKCLWAPVHKRDKSDGTWKEKHGDTGKT